MFYQVLVFSSNIANSNKNLGARISEFFKVSDSNKLIDLGSGNGYATAELIMSMPKEERPFLILTDYHPQVGSYRELREQFGEDSIGYVAESISFFDLPRNLPGDCFFIDRALHHLKPEQVKRLFDFTTKNYNGIICAEAFMRTWWTLSSVTLCSFFFSFAALLNPKKISLEGIVFGFVIPLVPLIFAWDTFVSILRTYTKEELLALLPENAKGVYGCHYSRLGVSSYYFYTYRLEDA